MHTIKPKKRRVLGELKRNRRLTMNLTAAEYERLELKAKEAGLTMAVFVRRVSLEGKVIARLGEEDRELFREVVRVSNVLDGLYKLARADGVERVMEGVEGAMEGIGRAMATFETARNSVDGILNKIRS
jgi:hypothetical protein